MFGIFGIALLSYFRGGGTRRPTEGPGGASDMLPKGVFSPKPSFFSKPYQVVLVSNPDQTPNRQVML